MNLPTVSRPHFPAGYLEAPRGFVLWEYVEEQLVKASDYWLCSVQPDGRPHVVPKWGVCVKNCFYFDGSPGTRHARNIALNPAVAVHLESGEQVVIVNGDCTAVSQPDAGLAAEVARTYTQKYEKKGYAPAADQWKDGGLFEVVPRTALAWTKFTDDPTKFTF